MHKYVEYYSYVRVCALDYWVRAQEVEVVERVRVEVAVGDARRDQCAPEVGPLAAQLLGRVEAVRELRGAGEAALRRLPDAVQHLHLRGPHNWELETYLTNDLWKQGLMNEKF